MWTHSLEMADRLIATDEVALTFRLEDDIVSFAIKVLDLGLQRVGLGASRGPTVGRVLATPHGVKVEGVFGEGVLVKLVINVKILCHR